MGPDFEWPRRSVEVKEPLKARDSLHEWYTSSDQDWEDFMVPHAFCDAHSCHPDEDQDVRCSFVVESVSWPCEVDLDRVLSTGLDRHRVPTQLLSIEETNSSTDRETLGISKSKASQDCAVWKPQIAQP